MARARLEMFKDNTLFIAELKGILTSRIKKQKEARKYNTYGIRLREFKRICKVYHKTFLTPREFRALVVTSVDSVRFDRWMQIIRQMIQDSGYIPVKSGLEIVRICEESSDDPFDFKLEGTGTRYWVKEGTERLCISDPKTEKSRRELFDSLIKTPSRPIPSRSDPLKRLEEFGGGIWVFEDGLAYPANSESSLRLEKEFTEILVSMGIKSFVEVRASTERPPL